MNTNVARFGISRWVVVLLAGLPLGTGAVGCAMNAGDGGLDDGELGESDEAVCSVMPPPIADVGGIWPDGVVYYDLDASITNDQRLALEAGMTAWQTATNNTVRFVRSSNHSERAIIRHITDDEGHTACNAWAYLSAPGTQFANIGEGCKILHELGHLIGRGHEHQRLDRDRYVEMHVGTATCDDYGEYTKYVPVVRSGTGFGPYDTGSMMHYVPNAAEPEMTRIVHSSIPLGWGEKLTEADGNAVRELYSRQHGWDRFRSLGVDLGPNQPLSYELVPGTKLETNAKFAVARAAGLEVTLARDMVGKTYIRTVGRKSSDWRLFATGPQDAGGTSYSGEFTFGFRWGTKLYVRSTTNASAAANAGAGMGDNAALNTLQWSTWILLGQPSSSVTVASAPALASSGSGHLAVYVRGSDSALWTRELAYAGGPWSDWTKLHDGVTGRPAAIAIGHRTNQVFFSTTPSANKTTIRALTVRDGAALAGTELALATATAGSSPTAALTPERRHLLFRNHLDGNLAWMTYDGNAWGPYREIGGSKYRDPLATNSQEPNSDGDFAVYGQMEDRAIWRRSYSRYLDGRGGLPVNDSDRDTKTDLVIVNGSTWFVQQSNGRARAPFAFGAATDTFLPMADYDGDSILDFAVFRPSDGSWRTRGADFEAPVRQFGVSTDRPVPGDYDGDGIADLAVFRPSNSNWYIHPSRGGSDIVVHFGVASDTLVPADYDGDGKTDVAIFRGSEGMWYVHPSAGGSDIVRAFGTASDILVPADYDGDGRADFALFRPSNGTWYIRPQLSGPDLVIPFGEATDRPVPGDYDGDGRTDPAVFRPRDGNWYATFRTGAPDMVTRLGGTTSVTPVRNAW